ncbi:peroxisomal membrane protein 11C isoform X6 [Passer domesticus]|uniref:peroxisomal membrane protein 11C isoform X6 n=1 Tax=Passer domesticus TaxID=48849 RepID=UPI0030FE23A7
MAAGALWGLVAALETHRGRDRALRALSYGCQLAGAALPGPAGLPGGLLAASAQLSSCRTALRLFDDLAMLRHSCSYGLGPEVSGAPGAPPPRGRGRAGAGALGALQRGQPAVLPLRAPGLGRRCGRRPRRPAEVVGAQHGAVGLCPAAGHPAIPEDFVPVKKRTEPAQVQHFTSEAAAAESPGEG